MEKMRKNAKKCVFSGLAPKLRADQGGIEPLDGDADMGVPSGSLDPPCLL
jgi:hypothetical protein